LTYHLKLTISYLQLSFNHFQVDNKISRQIFEDIWLISSKAWNFYTANKMEEIKKFYNTHRKVLWSTVMNLIVKLFFYNYSEKSFTIKSHENVTTFWWNDALKFIDIYSWLHSAFYLKTCTILLWTIEKN
jgi:hypothetical protein